MLGVMSSNRSRAGNAWIGQAIRGGSDVKRRVAEISGIDARVLLGKHADAYVA